MAWIELENMSKHMKKFISGQLSWESLEHSFSRDVVQYSTSRTIAERVITLLEKS